MERLRDLAAWSKRTSAFPFTFSPPNFRGSTSEVTANNDLAPAPPTADGAQSHTKDQGSVKLPFQTEASTQTEVDDKAIFQDFRIVENKLVAVQACPPEDQLAADQADRNTWTKAVAAKTLLLNDQLTKNRAKKDRRFKGKKKSEPRPDDTQQQLFIMADILQTNGDMLTDSAASLSRSLNEVARDIIDTNITFKRRAVEIAALNDQMSHLQKKFDVAYAKLQEAQLINSNAIDSGVSQIHAFREIEKMMQALHEIRVIIEGQDIGTWDTEKINVVLEKLDDLWSQNEKNYQDPHVTLAIHDLGQRFQDANFDPKHAHLLGSDQDVTAKLEALKNDKTWEQPQDATPKPSQYHQNVTKKDIGKASPLKPSPTPGSCDETLNTMDRQKPIDNETVQCPQDDMGMTAFPETVNPVSEAPPRKLVTMRYRKDKLTIQQLTFLESIPSVCTTRTASPTLFAPSALNSTATSCHGLNDPDFVASEAADSCCCLSCAISSWARCHPDLTLAELNNSFAESGNLELLHAHLAEGLEDAPEHIKAMTPTVQDVTDWVDDILRTAVSGDDT